MGLIFECCVCAYFQFINQKLGISKHPKNIHGWAILRDDFLYECWRLIVEYDIKPENTWNFDQSGQANNMLSDLTIAPVGEGQFQDCSSYKGRERHTITVGMNGLGRFGYCTLTYKEKDGEFGPDVFEALCADPNTRFIAVQPSTSGIQGSFVNIYIHLCPNFYFCHVGHGPKLLSKARNFGYCLVSSLLQSWTCGPCPTWQQLLVEI